MKSSIYLRFSGGLGNQMFQYAQMKALIAKGRNAYPNMQWYETDMGKKVPFILLDIFPNADIAQEKKHKICWSRALQRVKKAVNLLVRHEVFYVGEHKDSVYESDIDKKSGGTWDGYWQSEKYFVGIEEEIRNDFTFCEDNLDLQAWIEQIEATENAVSIHIRRGDYLDTSSLYGGICTQEYYKKALQYMRERLDDPIFYVFSNDVTWVKENFVGEDFIYVEGNAFRDYENWFDMCLMSHCRHNIIANSSFSWWGAWLNKHEDKIVVAPAKWINTSPATDIWVEDWVKVQG